MHFVCKWTHKYFTELEHICNVLKRTKLGFTCSLEGKLDTSNHGLELSRSCETSLFNALPSGNSPLPERAIARGIVI